MTLQTDTLSCDTARLAHWQNNPLYDYNRELQTPDMDLYGWLDSQLMKLLSRIFGSRFAHDYSEVILITIFVVIVVLLVWFIYKKRPELFMRSGKKRIAYTIHEDTIYGVDFEAEITAALSRENYREAIRLLYLQTLKFMSDAGTIDWQLFKTPTQYIYEVKPEELRERFRRLTTHFLRVRYGNFEATRSLFDEMEALQTEIRKGGMA